MESAFVGRQVEAMETGNDKTSEEGDDNLTSDDEDEIEPSKMLKIMVDKHDAIEKVVCLIQTEVAQDEPNKEPDAPQPTPEEEVEPKQLAETVGSPSIQVGKSPAPTRPTKELFDGLNNLLDDVRVQHMIRGVSVETESVIDRARGAINGSKTIEDKRSAFSLGLMRLQMNLAGRKDQLSRDPNYSLAMSLINSQQAASTRKY